MSQPAIDHRTLKALGHPLRLRILTALHEKTASPSELAREFGEPLYNVSYHVRSLVTLEMIELVRTQPRRGALEHFYRGTRRAIISSEEWGQMPTPMRHGYLESILQQVADDLGVAAGRGFERDTAHLTRSPVILDREGWDEISGLLDDVLLRVEEIRQESAERLREDDTAEAITAGTVLMLYEAGAGQIADADSPRPAR